MPDIAVKQTNKKTTFFLLLYGRVSELDISRGEYYLWILFIARYTLPNSLRFFNLEHNILLILFVYVWTSLTHRHLLIFFFLYILSIFCVYLLFIYLYDYIHWLY